MKILAQECTALQTLKLWIHEKLLVAVPTSGETDAWIRATLALRVLRRFDMPALMRKHTASLQEQHLQSTSRMMALLRSPLLESDHSKLQDPP